MFLSKLFRLLRRSEPSLEPVVTSIPTVAFDSSRVTVPVKADILSTLKSYTDIPEAKLPAINKAAVASVERGRDLGMLCNAIMSSGITGMTEGRAAEITRHVHSRATSLMDAERTVALGVEEAVWRYSGAPCYVRTKAPSAAQLALDADHRAADGQRYRVRDGLTIGGKPTWPGREMGCKCVSRSVVKGFP